MIPLVLSLHLEVLNPDGAWNFYALGIFLIAVVTDRIDGYIARKRNQITSFGKLMDPLADKLIVLSALVMLTQLGIVPGWITIIILGRALLVTGLRGLASSEGIVLPASNLGKLKTFSQVLAILLLLLEGTQSIFLDLGFIILLIATAITLYSGFDYFLKYISN